MRKTIKGFHQVFLFLLAMLCIVACQASTQNSETDKTNLVENLEIQGENLPVEAHVLPEEMELMITTALDMETMSPTMVSMQNLPDEDTSNYKNSQARVKKRDSARNDSDRDRMTFEQVVFRQCSIIDSLHNVILGQQNIIAKYQAVEMARAGTTKVDGKQSSNWYKWMLGGVLFGGALSSLPMLYKRTQIGTIVKTLINKVTKLWQK